MIITKADQPVLRFDDQKQEWILITPVVMAQAQLALAVNHCREVYRKRMLGEIGSKRKRMQDAVAILDPRTVKQFIIGKGEKVMYHNGKL